jgi:hypothetical protein
MFRKLDFIASSTVILPIMVSKPGTTGKVPDKLLDREETVIIVSNGRERRANNAYLFLVNIFLQWEVSTHRHTRVHTHTHTHTQKQAILI